jgi:hypothetical protein
VPRSGSEPIKEAILKHEMVGPDRAWVSTLNHERRCRRHNSLLSPIDTAGARLFEAIQKCGTTDTGPGLLFLLSGHDVERWMLRSLTAGAAGFLTFIQQPARPA